MPKTQQPPPEDKKVQHPRRPYPPAGARFNVMVCRAQRIARSMTQQDAAVAIGATVTSWCRWETGYCQPAPMFLKRIAELFECKIEDLLM